jgi:hypothetical protein
VGANLHLATSSGRGRICQDSWAVDSLQRRSWAGSSFRCTKMAWSMWVPTLFFPDVCGFQLVFQTELLKQARCFSPRLAINDVSSVIDIRNRPRFFRLKKQPTIDKKKQPYTPYYSKQTAFLFFFCFISWMLGCCSDGWCLMCGSRFCLQLAFSRLTQMLGAVNLFWLQFNSRFGCFLLCSTLLPRVLLVLLPGVGAVLVLWSGASRFAPRCGSSQARFFGLVLPTGSPEGSTRVFFCFCFCCRACLT